MRAPARHGFAREDLGIADDLDPGMPGLENGPMGFGMGERHAGAQHQGIKRAEVELVKIRDRQPRSPRLLDGRLGIIPGVNLGAAKPQRLDAGRARARESEDRELPSLE